jgi:hypothetical protein
MSGRKSAVSTAFINADCAWESFYDHSGESTPKKYLDVIKAEVLFYEVAARTRRAPNLRLPRGSRVLAARNYALTKIRQILCQSEEGKVDLSGRNCCVSPAQLQLATDLRAAREAEFE